MLMKKFKIAVLAVTVIYLILLIPESQSDKIEVAKHTQFVWNKDSLWQSLEIAFTDAIKNGCNNTKDHIGEKLIDFSNILKRIIMKLQCLDKKNLVYFGNIYN